MDIDYRTMSSEMTVSGILRLESPLRVGAIGETPESVLRCGDHPIVKSSSIKGLLRSEFTRLESTTKGEEWNGISVDVHGYGKADLKWSDIIFGVSDLDSGTGKKFSLRGALRVSDVIFRENIAETRPHVRIDRSSRTAADGGLFSLESLCPGMVADFELRLQNFMLPDPLRILCFVVDEIGCGNLPIGGLSTIGHGRVHVDSYRVELRKTPSQILGIAPPTPASGESLQNCIDRVTTNTP